MRENREEKGKGNRVGNREEGGREGRKRGKGGEIFLEQGRRKR